jgi:hypothetical protein
LGLISGGDQLRPGLSHRFRFNRENGPKRKIDLPENPLKWLAPYRNRSGAISDRDFRRPLARACEPARVKYKRNALQHSFGSYRMEMVKNAGQIALEMGNSAAIMMKHYFDIVGHEQRRITGTSDQFRALIERS